MNKIVVNVIVVDVNVNIFEKMVVNCTDALGQQFIHYNKVALLTSA